MSIPPLPDEPLTFVDSPSTETPIASVILNPWGEQIHAIGDAARTYALSAQQSAAEAGALTDQAVAAVVSTDGTTTRQELDARYVGAAAVGTANGVAALDENATIPVAQIPTVYAAKHADTRHLAVIGDSIVFGYNGAPATEGVTPWPALVQYLAPGYTVVNAGVSGDALADVLARLDGVLALSPGGVHVAAGTNDINTGRDPAAMRADALAIAARLAQASVPVTWHAVLPRSGAATTAAKDRLIRSWNRWLAETLCPSHGFAFLDVYTTFADGAGVKAGYLSDGRHPTARGYWEYAKAVEADLTPAPSAPYLFPGEATLYTDSLLTGDGGTVNAQFQHLATSGVTSTPSLVARAAGLGNWQQSVRSGGTSDTQSAAFVGVAFLPLAGIFAAPGDLLSVLVDFDVVGGTLNGCYLRVRVGFEDAGGTLLGNFQVGSDLHAPVEDLRFGGHIEVPDGAATARLLINCYGDTSATWRFGRPVIAVVQP